MQTPRSHAEQLDAQDALSHFRDQFQLPKGVVYLDGNSLGPLPKSTVSHLDKVTHTEWGERLIRSWNISGWMDMPWRVGNKIGRLVGAADGEVISADSTSINVFKTISAALALRPDRKVILSATDNFPTDLYMIQGLIQQLSGKHELRLVDAEKIGEHLASDVAVMALTHINYRSGRMYDMAALTSRAHSAGALVMWDLAHSAGAVPVNLNAAQADFAVGCGYKYLNGGPGAPAWLFVAERHQQGFSQPLSGWLGHSNPFAFSNEYEPADGIGRYMCGTPPVLSMSALECGVDMFIQADMQRVREKSLALTDYFIKLIDERCTGQSLVLATPRDHAIRGSQVSYHHPEGYAIMQALIARGVIGDFRAPDIIRFGFTPLFTTFGEVWDAVDHLAQIFVAKEWDRPEWKQRKIAT